MTHLYVFLALLLLFYAIDIISYLRGGFSAIFYPDKTIGWFLPSGFAVPTFFAIILFFIAEATYWLLILIKLIISLI